MIITTSGAPACTGLHRARAPIPVNPHERTDMADLTIYLGNKNYSSWSLRAWLPLRQTGAAFEEVVIPLDHPETKQAIGRHSPSGRVPALRDGEFVVWESLAVGEYLAERFPAAKLWPEEPRARAIARAVCAEMHAGFAALRAALPMDMRNRYPGHRRNGAVERDIGRIVAIWSECRARFGDTGDFLFGGPGIADAFFAPVVSRFVTYEVDLPGPAAAYRDAIWNWPALQEWKAAAEAEPWVIDYPKP
jgi:glutathione S-transferase